MSDDDEQSTELDRISTPVEDIELLLEEARAELTRQQRELHKITTRATRNVQFVIISLPIIFGVAQLGDAESITVTDEMFISGVLIFISVLLSILVMNFESDPENIPNQMSGLPRSGSISSDMNNDHALKKSKDWKKERLQSYIERIDNVLSSRQNAGEAVLFSTIINPLFLLVIFIDVLDQIDQISRFEKLGLNIDPTFIFIFAVIASLTLLFILKKNFLTKLIKRAYIYIT